jgi:hypothetical protein
MNKLPAKISAWSMTFLVLLLSGVAVAADSAFQVKGDFDGDGKTDYFQYDPQALQNGVDYYSSSNNKTYHFTVEIEGVCGDVQIYAPYQTKDEIAIDGSCTGQGAQVLEYIYKWDKQRNTWCLREDISGEKADITSGSTANLTTTKVNGCVPFGKADG